MTFYEKLYVKMLRSEMYHSFYIGSLSSDAFDHFASLIIGPHSSTLFTEVVIASEAEQS